MKATSSDDGGTGRAPKGKRAVPPCLVSNTVRTYFLSLDVSETARAAVEGAKWLEARQCWALTLTPAIADELGMATLKRLDA